MVGDWLNIILNYVEDFILKAISNEADFVYTEEMAVADAFKTVGKNISGKIGNFFGKRKLNRMMKNMPTFPNFELQPDGLYKHIKYNKKLPNLNEYTLEEVQVEIDSQLRQKRLDNQQQELYNMAQPMIPLDAVNVEMTNDINGDDEVTFEEDGLWYEIKLGKREYDSPEPIWF